MRHEKWKSDVVRNQPINLILQFKKILMKIRRNDLEPFDIITAGFPVCPDWLKANANKEGIRLQFTSNVKISDSFYENVFLQVRFSGSLRQKIWKVASDSSECKHIIHSSCQSKRWKNVSLNN